MAKKKVSKRWTPTEAQRVLESADRSGLSDRAYAKRSGLDPQRLWWWRRRLEQEGRQGERVDFVEVRPKASVSPELLEVRLGNGRVVSVVTTIEGRPC